MQKDQQLAPALRTLSLTSFELCNYVHVQHFFLNIKLYLYPQMKYLLCMTDMVKYIIKIQYAK